MSIESALVELRLATRAEHDRIEDVLRLTEAIPLARYAAIICGFSSFMQAWEPRIHDALPAHLRPWFQVRRRGGFARSDVEWLRTVAGIDTVPMPADLALALPLTDLAEVFGSLYVIEGSALGGRVIAPHLKRTLGLEQGGGASYFHGFGDATGAMWSDFRTRALDAIGSSSDGTTRACQSARRTYLALIGLFEPLACRADFIEE